MPNRFITAVTGLAALGIATPASGDNIAACEAVIMTDVEGGAATIASFRDASLFIASVMDEEQETLTQIDGFDIAALMCTRRSPIPKMSDVPLIRSGVPFVLSTDFESADAPTVNIAINEAGEAVALMAAGLTQDQETALMAYLDAVPPIEMTPAHALDEDSEEAFEESMDAE